MGTKTKAATLFFVLIAIIVCILAFGLKVDWFLSVVVAVVAVMSVVLNLYLVAAWADPIDQQRHPGTTGVVLCAMAVSEAVVFGLPLDVATNARLDCSPGHPSSECGGTSTTTLEHSNTQQRSAEG